MDHAEQLASRFSELGYQESGQRLIRICAALQAHHEPEPFFLASRQAGELLGMHFTEAAKMLVALVADGVLTLISKGAGMKASRYRFSE